MSGPSSNPTTLRAILLGLRREALWVALFGCFSNLLLLTPTLYMMQVFDRVLLSGSEWTLAALSAVTAVFFVVMAFAEWARSRLLVRAGNRFDQQAQRAIFGASFEASLPGTNRAATQPFNDLTQLRQFLTGNGIFALVDTPWVAVYTAVLFLIHPWLGWTALGFVVLTLVLAVAGNRLASPLHERAQQAQIDANLYLAGKLRNAETVEALGMLGDLRQRWLGLQRELVDHATRAQGRAQAVQSTIKFVQYAQQAAVLALGALLAIDGRISAGSMIACNALMGLALRPISVVVQVWKPFVEARSAYQRLERLLAGHPPREGGEAADALRGAVTLRGLVASAPGRKTPILNGLNAEVSAGQVVGIVGPSGAGKSTLARCLLGIWPDVQGEVLLDGRPLAAWERESLGARVGYLPQDIEMFDGTIAENISRFSPGLEPHVIDAARRAGIHEMILRLPKGYDTPMGEAGSALSGGQRQRIGLARALVGAPRLVVLDEPSANLDDAGEAGLLRAVADLKASGCTVFMIVHQQHLLAAADRVLVLEAGRITQDLPVRPAAPARNETLAT